jgi:putative flippase GtrA
MIRHVKKVCLALTGGILTFLLEAGLTIILTEVVGLHSTVSYAISLILGLLVLFHFHRHLTFKVKREKIEQLAKFYTLYGISYFTNWILVVILSIFINYIYAIVIINIILWPMNYLVNDQWVFRKKATNP